MAGSGRNTKPRNENTLDRERICNTQWWLRYETPGSAGCIRLDQAVIPSSIASTSRPSPTTIPIIRHTNPKPEEGGEEVSIILHQEDTRTEGAGAGEPVCFDLIHWDKPKAAIVL